MSHLQLEPLTEADCEEARGWRHAEIARPGLRTPFMLTREMQADFYRTVISNRSSHHRYWAVKDAEEGTDRPLLSMTGLTDIAWENGIAEISLITRPGTTGIGRATLALVLQEAFHRMRLLTVFGEVYENNPAVGFWRKMVEERHARHTILPRRKWWDGRLHDAFYFTFTAEAFQ